MVAEGDVIHLRGASTLYLEIATIGHTADFHVLSQLDPTLDTMASAFHVKEKENTCKFLSRLIF
jgi:hypothetical protein